MRLAVGLLVILSYAVTTSHGAPRNRKYSYEEKIMVFNWLVKYNYYDGPLPDEHNIDAVMNEPLRHVKRFYRIKGIAGRINGRITPQIMSLIKMPRCDDPDEPVEHRRTKRYTKLTNDKWTRMPVTISFKNYLTGQKGLGQGVQRQVMQECADLWASESTLSFDILKRGLGDIELQWLYLDGPWGNVGKGLSPTPYWPDKPSWIKLDTSESWKMNNKDNNKYKVSMKWAMCHELGHTLALGHSGDKRAIMYPSGVGQDEDKLSRDDINGIRSIYGAPNGRPTDRTTTQRPRTTTRRPRTTTSRPRNTTRRPRPTTRRPRPTTRRPRPTTRRPRPTTRRPRPTTTRRPTTVRPWWLRNTPSPRRRTYRRRSRPHPYSFQHWWYRYGQQGK